MRSNRHNGSMKVPSRTARDNVSIAVLSGLLWRLLRFPSSFIRLADGFTTSTASYGAEHRTDGDISDIRITRIRRERGEGTFIYV